MTLREKLQLPSAKWLLFGAIVLIIIGIAKLFMWIVPLTAAAVVKVGMWLAPIAWQGIITIAAMTCAVFALAWRLRKQRKIVEDVLAGTVIIFDAEYSVEM